jgi:hypothetical protein
MKISLCLLIIFLFASCGNKKLEKGQNIYINKTLQYDKLGLIDFNKIELYQKYILKDDRGTKKQILRKCPDCSFSYLNANHQINLEDFYRIKSSLIGTYQETVLMNDRYDGANSRVVFEYYKIITNPKIKVHNKKSIFPEYEKYFNINKDTFYIKASDVIFVQADSLYQEEI